MSFPKKLFCSCFEPAEAQCSQPVEAVGSKSSTSTAASPKAVALDPWQQVVPFLTRPGLSEGPWLEQLLGTASALQQIISVPFVSISAVDFQGENLVNVAAAGPCASDLPLWTPVRASSRVHTSASSSTCSGGACDKPVLSNQLKPTGMLLPDLVPSYMLDRQKSYTSDTSTSIQQLLRSHRGSTAWPLEMQAGTSTPLPPDWADLHAKYGLSHFMAVPVYGGDASQMVGALVLAHAARTPPPLWDASRVALLCSPAVSRLLQLPQLQTALSLIEDISRAPDIGSLVQLIMQGASTSASAVSFMEPQCRVALLRTSDTPDALAQRGVAAVFEQVRDADAPRRTGTDLTPAHTSLSRSSSAICASMANIAQAQIAAIGHMEAGTGGWPVGAASEGQRRYSMQLASRAVDSAGFMSGRYTAAEALPEDTRRTEDGWRPTWTSEGSTHRKLSAAQVSMEPALPSIAGTPPASPARRSSTARPSMMGMLPECGSPLPSAGAAVSPLASAPRMSWLDEQLASPPVAPLPSPASRMHESSPAQAADADYGGRPSLLSRMGMKASASTGSLSQLAGSAAGGLRCHSLDLNQTLLQESLQRRCGVFISDIMLYISESEGLFPKDLVVSKAHQTINSITVSVGYLATSEPLAPQVADVQATVMAAASAPRCEASTGVIAEKELPAPSARTSEVTCEVGGALRLLPVLAAYCCFKTALPAKMLKVVAQEIDMLMEALAPIVLEVLTNKMGQAWEQLVGQVMQRTCMPHHNSSPQVPVVATAHVSSVSITECLRGKGVGSTDSSIHGPAVDGRFPLSASSTNLRESSQGQLQARAGSQDMLPAPAADISYSSIVVEPALGSVSTSGPLTPLLTGMHGKLRELQAKQMAENNSLDDLMAISVQHKIGQGGYGSVFLGMYHNHEVAVKVVYKDAQPLKSPKGPEVVEAVVLNGAVELAVGFAVVHPNIVSVIAYFTDVCVAEFQEPHPHAPGAETTRAVLYACGEDMPEALGAVTSPLPPRRAALVMVMEYCDMGSLWSALQRNVFIERKQTAVQQQSVYSSWSTPNMPHILATLLDLALALRHLHQLNLVHCDVNPSNLLLKSNPRDPRGFVVKLSDMGLTKLMTENAEGRVSIASHKQRCGTVNYCAPEMMLEGTYLDAALDIYAFGIVMYNLYTGDCRVYGSLSQHEIMVKVVQGVLRPRFPQHVPSAYRTLAERCWAADRALRPTSTELVREVKRLMGMNLGWARRQVWAGPEKPGAGGASRFQELGGASSPARASPASPHPHPSPAGSFDQVANSLAAPKDGHAFPVHIL